VVSLAAGNRIDAPGTGEATWWAWPELELLPAADIAGWASAVILAAHPDDEVLGVGGTMSLLAASGASIRLIAITDGEASHPQMIEPEALAERRAAETAAALLALGAAAAQVIRIRLPDTGLAARQDELETHVRALTDGFDVCLAPWEKDAHADHEAVGRSARRACVAPVSFYPVWTWHWAVPGDARVPWTSAVRVPLPPAVAARKHAAIKCFTSQLETRDDGLGPVLTAGVVEHFSRRFEILFPARQP
jgi:LmbE family N-acetylglucosaminyl deacetylase